MILTASAARIKAVTWARQIMADEDVVLADTETTGLGPDAEIIDVAVIDRGGAVLLDTLIRPARPVPPAAAAIHHLTDDLLIDESEFWHVYPKLATALRGKTLCIFNAEYDVGMIRQVCKAHGLPDPVSAFQCCMRAYADFRGERKEGGMRGDEFRWRSLETACQAFGIPPGGHRALSDAEACRRVVIAMSESPL